MKDTQIEITNEAKPKYIAQKCPVCNGWGTVSNQRVTCHACEGRGCIMIPIEKERYKDYDRPR